MAQFHEESILLSNLGLDSRNPRHKFLESQREIIEWMVSGTGRIGDKLLVLAKDIVQNGLNPAERVMVLKDEKKEKQFLVLEGNRRVTALKLLNNPDTAPTKEWQNRFAKLASQGYSRVSTLPCVVFDEPTNAYHFIELKHLGESGGAGIVPWDAEQKARHDQRTHRRSRHHKALAVLDYIRTSDEIKDQVKGSAGEGFPLTTLDRLLSDTEFREFLGLGLNKDGNVIFEIDPEESTKALVKVISDFGSGKKNVRDVINKKMRDEYKNTFTGPYHPDQSKRLKTAIAVDDFDSVQSTKKAQCGPGTPRYSSPTNRRFIVIPGTNLAIDPRSHNRPRRVFEELKRIPLRDKDGRPQYPNGGILLLRLFIEMSIDSFIAARALKHPSPTGWKDVSLTERTRSVLAELQHISGITPQEAKVVNKALGDKNKLANPNSLNDFAHNIHQIPNPNDLIDLWDTYCLFLTKLWENM